jgi:hypothetical protein
LSAGEGRVREKMTSNKKLAKFAELLKNNNTKKGTGIKILDDTVLTQIESVIETILNSCTPSPYPLPHSTAVFCRKIGRERNY